MKMKYYEEHNPSTGFFSVGVNVSGVSDKDFFKIKRSVVADDKERDQNLSLNIWPHNPCDNSECTICARVRAFDARKKNASL